MPQITDLKIQKKRDRVNVYVDGKYSFSLDYESYYKSGLKINQTISEDKIKNISCQGDFQKILDKILAFANIRPRSMWEFENWMKRKKVENSIKKDLFEKLRKFGFVDDYKFGQWWIDQRREFRPKPKRVLRIELVRKGLDKNIIRELLQDTTVNEEKLAKKIVKKNLYRWKKYDISVRKNKAISYLVRKGFDWATARKVYEICEFDQEG